MRLIELLAESGLKSIEVGSFVSKKWVPQMADSDKVAANSHSCLRHIRFLVFYHQAASLYRCKPYEQVYELAASSKIGALSSGSVALSALTPNLVGLEAALKAGVKEIGK